MGIEAKYSVTIVKTCDGCGERWEARQVFSHVAAVLSFGGPVEAADWTVRVTSDGCTQLLCRRCSEHLEERPPS